MKRILAAAVLAATLSACAMQPGEYTATPLTAAQEAEVKRAVGYRLKDEPSARYRNLALITRTNGQQYVCGQVNSRNSFGGYTGFMAFMGRFEGDRFNLQLAETPQTQGSMVTACPR